jgi:hypothetical protein
MVFVFRAGKSVMILSLLLLIFTVSVSIAGATEGESSCITCHTDVGTLEMLTADMPKPKASALQSGAG